MQNRSRRWSEQRESTPEDKAEVRAIEARPKTATQRVVRNNIDHRIGLIINRELNPAYIRTSLISIEGFEVDGKPAAEPWDTLIINAPDELIDELYVAANPVTSPSPYSLRHAEQPPGHHPYKKMSVLFSSSGFLKTTTTAREGNQIVESNWSPNRPNRRFGVHLASKSHVAKSFVFSEGCP